MTKINKWEDLNQELRNLRDKYLEDRRYSHEIFDAVADTRDEIMERFEALEKYLGIEYISKHEVQGEYKKVK